MQISNFKCHEWLRMHLRGSKTLEKPSPRRRCSVPAVAWPLSVLAPVKLRAGSAPGLLFTETKSMINAMHQISMSGSIFTSIQDNMISFFKNTFVI